MTPGLNKMLCDKAPFVKIETNHIIRFGLRRTQQHVCLFPYSCCFWCVELLAFHVDVVFVSVVTVLVRDRFDFI